MNYPKLFFIVAISSLLCNYSYTAEQKAVIEPIPLENGLLTKVSTKFIVLKTSEHNNNYYADKITENIYTDSLINLMRHQYATANICSDKIPSISSPMFYPTLLEYADNGAIINRGSFSKSVDKEAKEACRLKIAIFYPYKQGAIIYALNEKRRGNFIMDKANISLIEKMIDHNLEKTRKRFFIQLPVLTNNICIEK